MSSYIMSREFIAALIERYKRHPILWNSSHTDHNNKPMRDRAYKDMVKLAKNYITNIDEKAIKQKLRNLRTTFRKELRKVEESIRNGATDDEVYVPNLWYYDLLLFIRTDVPCASIESMYKCNKLEEISNSYLEGNNSQKLNESSQECSEVEEELIESVETLRSASDVSISEDPISPPVKKVMSPQKGKRKHSRERSEPDTDNPAKIKKIDECSSLGYAWGSRLRELQKDQRVLAETFVTQVLQHAYFGELTRNSKFIVASNSSDDSYGEVQWIEEHQFDNDFKR